MSDATSETALNQPTPEAGVEPDGINTPTLVMWGFVSVVITVSVMLAASALFFQAQNSINQERIIAAPNLDSDEVLNNQLGVLTSYASPKAEGEPYKIPINVAKDLVLAELQSKADD